MAWPRSASLEHVAGELLRLLDVGLVERVDAEDRPGDRGRDLPADELPAEVDRVGERDADHRVAALRECVGEGRPAAVAAAVERDAHEHPVIAVGLGGADRLAVDRHDAGAALAGALGDELLGPGPERGDLVVGQERELVAARRREGAEGEPERDARVGVGVGLAARAEHRARRGEQRVEVEADQRRWHQPDVRQRAVAAADVGRVEEHLAELVVVADRLDALARVGDGHDHRARLLPGVVLDGVERLLRALPRRGQEGVRLHRRAGLAGDDDQGRERFEVVEDRRHRGGVGRVEDAQVEVALGRPERPVQHVRGEAAAAHAGHDGRREPGVDDPVAEALERRDVVGEVDRGVEPAQPVGDGRRDRGILGP